MLNFIKKNLFIVIIFFITLLLGFLTFLTFLDKSFIKLNDQNLQYLLLSNIVLLIIFFSFIFLVKKRYILDERSIYFTHFFIILNQLLKII